MGDSAGSAPCRCLVLRHQRHQRAHDPRRAGAGAPADAEPGGTARTLPVVPWLLSGKTPEALAGQARKLLTYLEDHPDTTALDVAYSLAATRAALDHRAGVTGTDRDELLAGLRTVAAGTATAVRARADRLGGTAFLFTGQGLSGCRWGGSCMGCFRCSRRRSMRRVGAWTRGWSGR
ncbi:hypothetical protein ACFQ3Z_43470 [Streptomyces nogalater]